MSVDSQPAPEADPELGYCWHLDLDSAVEDALSNPGRVVVRCAKAELAGFATVWKAQPLARFLTRGSEVAWQGVGLKGHW